MQHLLRVWTVHCTATHAKQPGNCEPRIMAAFLNVSRAIRDSSHRALLCTLAEQKLTAAWENEREEMKKLQAIKAEIDRVNLEVQNAEREYDLNRAAELKYGVLVTLQKQLKQAEEALTQQVHRPQACCDTCPLRPPRAWPEW